jgi:hypothetical protein
MGWDRPLQGFFLVVITDNDDEGLIYSNLDDPELIYCGGLPSELEYFRNVLVSLDIAVPARMLTEIESDGEVNCGNRSVVYRSDGSIESDTGQSK